MSKQNESFVNALRDALHASIETVGVMTVEEHQHEEYKSAQFMLDAMQVLAREQARARLNEVKRKRERAENLVLEFFQEECRLAAFLARQQELPLEQGDAVDEWGREAAGEARCGMSWLADIAEHVRKQGARP